MLRKPLVAAMARHRAATHDEVCAASAPTAWAAAMMMAIVLPKPTRAATTADVTIDRRMTGSADFWRIVRKTGSGFPHDAPLKGLSIGWTPKVVSAFGARCSRSLAV